MAAGYFSAAAAAAATVATAVPDFLHVLCSSARMFLSLRMLSAYVPASETLQIYSENFGSDLPKLERLQGFSVRSDQQVSKR